MKNLFVSRRHQFLASFLLFTLFATEPAWSDLGKKPSIKEAANEVVPDKKSDKNVMDQEKDLKSGKKEGNSIKKSAVKKAGTAAAAGVATKKVTSTIKK